MTSNFYESKQQMETNLFQTQAQFAPSKLKVIIKTSGFIRRESLPLHSRAEFTFVEWKYEANCQHTCQQTTGTVPPSAEAYATSSR